MDSPSHRSPLVKGASFLCALLLVGSPLFFTLWKLSYHWSWGPVWEYRQVLINGWLMTLKLSAASLVVSVSFGFVLALLRRSNWLVLQYVSRIYVEVIRGTPLLVQILLTYYGIFDQVGLTNRFVAGVLILSAFAGAYISEIVRAGIESVGASQLESARAIGLTTAQTYRYVILPQAIRQILPPLAGQFASLIKDSSLLSVIAFAEFTQAAQNVNSNTFSTLETYIPLAIGYLILTLPLSLWTQRMEKRVRFET